MPSLLGRFVSFSFRTERLIMNIIGLINSTFDWNPLKWTNQLEQIQNISLSYGTLILETIGEDTIKTVLSWIVIARIVIAHVYTFSYLMNIYPILTWSRPNLLLPWLILSFFKNVVLEVIVLAVCLLLWYDKRFSLAIFLEFVLVKVVPLVLATYNWYSNSCLFLQLRHKEKMLELKRNLRDDMNYLSNRLYTKIADSKYRSRSLTTLLSYESYETFDTRDTISRIIDDPNLTPAQKTMKMLGLTEQDVMKARIRRNEMAIHRRLTEIEDNLLNINDAMDKRILMFDEEYEEQIRLLMNIRDDDSEEEDIIEEEIMVRETPSLSEDLQENHPEEAKMDPEESPVSEPSSKRIKEETDSSRINETKPIQRNPSVSRNSALTNKEDTEKLDDTRFMEEDEKNSNNSMKLRALFNCDCLMSDDLFRKIQEGCCLPSTLKGTFDDDEIEPNLELILNDESEPVIDERIDCEMSYDVPVATDLLENDGEVSESFENENLTKNVQGSLYLGKFGDEGGQIANRMDNLLGNVERALSTDTGSEQGARIVDKMDSLLGNVKQGLFFDEGSRQDALVVNKMENVQKTGLEILGNPFLGKLEAEGMKMENLFSKEESKQEASVVNKVETVQKTGLEILGNPFLGKLEAEGMKMENLFSKEESKQEASVVNQMESVQKTGLEILGNPFLGKLEAEGMKMENLFSKEESKQEASVVNQMESVQKTGLEILGDPFLGKLEAEGNQVENLLKNKQNPSLDYKSNEEASVVIKMKNIQKTGLEILENPFLGKLEADENQMENLFSKEELKQKVSVVNKMENVQKTGLEILENPFLGKFKTEGNQMENLFSRKQPKQEPSVINKIDNVQKTEYKILENIKEDPYLKRLVTEVKLKKETNVADRIADSLKNLKPKQEIPVEDKTEDPSEEKSKGKIEVESKTVGDDSCTKTLVVEENWKETVRRVTNEIDNLLQNYQKQKSSTTSVAEENSVKRIVNEIESSRGVQNRRVSTDTQNVAKIVGDTVTRPNENYGIFTIDVEESRVKLKTENEMLKTMVHMKTAVLADTNSTQKSGPRKFEPDGKNKSKVNVAEYSFGDTTLQCLLRQFENWKPFAHQSNAQTPLKRGVEINRAAVQNVRNSSTQTKGYEKIDRSNVTVSPKRSHQPKNQTSQKSQVDEQTLDNISPKPNQPPKTIPTISSKHSNSPPNSSVSSSRNSQSIVSDSNRSKAYLKRKRSKKQSQFPNTEVQEPAGHHEEHNRQPNASRSPSDRSVCECKMQELKAKCSPSSESGLGKKDEPRRSKVNAYGTATLAQVTRGAEFTTVTYRRKPPVYPRKHKTEEPPAQKVSPTTKSLQKSRTKASKDDRETRVLKAFNKDTLWRYKRELEAKRKFPFGGNNVDLLPEVSKARTRARKSNSRKRICQDAKPLAEEQLDKENYVQSSVRLDSSTSAAPSRLSNDDGKSGKVSDGGHACSKLSKVTRATDRVLDRLLSVQKQGQKRLANETENRKQFTKYTKPKKMMDEEVVGASSSKRLEGVQRGRELERTPGKEDIRGRSVDAGGSSRRQLLLRIENNHEDKHHDKQEDRSLKTIKPSVNQDVASKWSSSTVDQADEAPLLDDDKNLDTRDESLSTSNPADISKFQEVTSPSNQTEIEEINDSVTETSAIVADGTRRRSTNYTDFTRNIDVSHMSHGIVLTNPNAPRSKSPRLRDIVDDNTSRLLHQAFSYQSVDSFLDFAEDNITLNDIANERHPNTLDDGFVCQASNDAVDIFSDELPVVTEDPANLRETIPLALVENLHQGEENCNLIIAIDEDLALQGVNFVEFQLSNVLATVEESLRNMNVQEFGLDDVEESTRDPLSEDLEEEEEEEEEEGLEEEDRALRFIKEDVFTDIKFPVVINWSESVVGRDEDPEGLNSGINHEEPSNLIGSNDEEKLKEAAKIGYEGTKNLEQSVFFGKLKYSSEPEEIKNEGNDGSRRFFFGDSSSGRRYFESEEKPNVSVTEEVDRNVDKLEETVRLAEGRLTLEIEEIEEDTRPIDSRTEEEIDSEPQKEETASNDGNLEERIEEADRNIRRIELEIGKEETVFGLQSKGTEETDEDVKQNDTNETILLEESMELEEIEESICNSRLTSSNNEKEETTRISRSESDNERNDEVVESITESDEQKSNEEVSLMITCIFWMTVLFFFVRNWFRSLCSVERVSTSTSTLRPFDIRSAPVSTVKLLERMEREEEDDDLAKRIMEQDSNPTTEKISSGIIEIQDDSEGTEEEDEENMEIIETTGSNVLPSIGERVELFEEVFKVEDGKFGEEEIKTFRFEEVDDSSSTKSSVEQDDERGLLDDGRSSRPFAEAKIVEEEIQEYVEEKKVEEDGTVAEERDIEDRVISKDEMVTEAKIEEAEDSAEMKKTLSSLKNMDSFNSTFSRISDGSKRTVSDLNDSFMEEFEDS